MNDLTLTNYLECLLAGLLGIVFHLFAIKIPAMKKRAEVANEKFNLLEYLKSDVTAIISSFVTVLICLVILDEAIGVKPAIRPYLKFAFVFVGFTGSSVLIALLGTAQDKINKIVDLKTDIADGKK